MEITLNIHRKLRYLSMQKDQINFFYPNKTSSRVPNVTLKQEKGNTYKPARICLPRLMHVAVITCLDITNEIHCLICNIKACCDATSLMF